MVDFIFGLGLPLQYNFIGDAYEGSERPPEISAPSSSGASVNWYCSAPPPRGHLGTLLARRAGGCAETVGPGNPHSRCAAKCLS